MERLTKLNPLSGEIERNGLPQQLYKKLWEYEEAEEQGRLVRLPCKVGDKTYIISTGCVDNPNPERMCFCMGKSCEKCDKHFMRVWECTHHTINVASIVAHMGLMGETHSFGINIFLTEAEALQALKEREANA